MLYAAAITHDLYELELEVLDRQSCKRTYADAC
jgi:hypothetical protein